MTWIYAKTRTTATARPGKNQPEEYRSQGYGTVTDSGGLQRQITNLHINNMLK